MSNSSIAVYPGSVTIETGQWYYEAYAKDTSCCTECTFVRWYSEDSTVASVNEITGYIHGVSLGTTKIYATTWDRSSRIGDITVTVVEPAVVPIPVVGITISPGSLTMNVGDTGNISKTIYPSDATNKKVTWESSDESVASVKLYRGVVTAKNPGIAVITATTSDGKFTASCEVWVRGKTPVFLIHGRTSNSFGIWGAGNKIFVDPMDTNEADNNHFDPSIDALSQGNVQALYTSKSVQDIFGYQTGRTIEVDGTNVANFEMPGVFNGKFDDGKYTSEHPEGGNLAFYLKQSGYKENVNLFVFNYPNEDAVVHSANKFKKYIENLINYVRISGTNEMKACFYDSRCDFILENHKINLVGHSMGGLVSRYYIENLGQDNHVGKLITICTPHWGSGYADVGNFIGLGIHKLADHDLDRQSAMYGGGNSTQLNCYAGLSVDICYPGNYILTDELQYNKTRNTKYYAVAGIDFYTGTSASQGQPFEIPTGLSTYNEIKDLMTERGIYAKNVKDLSITVIDPKLVGDNMVGFMSQIGWSRNLGSTPNKKIQMEKILVEVDMNGGNSLISRLHSKIPHRKCVINKIIDYLAG